MEWENFLSFHNVSGVYYDDDNKNIVDDTQLARSLCQRCLARDMWALGCESLCFFSFPLLLLLPLCKAAAATHQNTSHRSAITHARFVSKRPNILSSEMVLRLYVYFFLYSFSARFFSTLFFLWLCCCHFLFFDFLRWFFQCECFLGSAHFTNSSHTQY